MKAGKADDSFIFDYEAKTISFLASDFSFPLMVVNLTKNQTLYLFNNPKLGGDWDIAQFILTLDCDTSDMNGDLLYIYVEDGHNETDMLQAIVDAVTTITLAGSAGVAAGLVNTTTSKDVTVTVEGEPGPPDTRRVVFGAEV